MLMILTVQTQMRKEAATAEAKTKRATFKLAQVPYGYYYMYAVANMGNLAELEKDNIQTVDKLKSINLTWEAENWFATEETDGKVTRATKPSDRLATTTKRNVTVGPNCTWKSMSSYK